MASAEQSPHPACDLRLASHDSHCMQHILKGPGMQTENVFIVGCNRTGTSLLRLILNKSKQVCIASETHFLRRLSGVGVERHLHRFAPLSDERNVTRLAEYLYSPHKSWRAAYWEWLRNNVDKRQFTHRLLESDRSERAIFSVLMQIYAEQVEGIATTDLVLGEKTPTHLYYVPTLLEWFPQAKIVHMFRDPRAIIVSKLKKVGVRGREGPKKKFSATPEWLIDPLVDPIEVIHMTKAWFDAARLHMVYEQQYPQRYYLLRFEDLMSDP